MPDLWIWVAKSRRAIDRGEMDEMTQMVQMLDRFGDGRFRAYVEVRMARRGGRSDPRGDERLKKSRYWQGMETSGGDSDEASDAGDSSST